MAVGMNPNSIEARDVAYHLHPYTNAQKHAEIGPTVIERGEGVYVTDSDGKRYIEAMAGLWSVALGFGERRLIDAAMRQMEELPFYHSFTHRSHRPVIELAEKLVMMAPVPMSKAFFTNSGSEANDTALKLIWYRANALGQPQRKKVISRTNSYHGTTIAMGCLTGLAVNHHSFEMALSGVLRTSCPHHWRNAQNGESEEAYATRLALELDDLILAEGPETIAAFFGEPVMGGGGVIVPPRTYWPKIQAVLRKYDILLVADEVICGFGRTGRMFGSETFGIEPDIMVFSKQLSSSYLPISALVANDKVLRPIVEESGRIGTLAHGFTGSGHPVAAAVALENIRIIEEEGLVERAAAAGDRLRTGLQKFQDHPLVGEVRGVGLIAAVELVADKAQKTAPEPAGSLGARLNVALGAHGVISRSMVDAVAFCPPLIIKPNEIDDLLGRFGKALETLDAG